MLMKIKMLLLIAIIACSYNVVKCCPVWRVAQLLVVDEYGKHLNFTKFWKVRGQLDSFEITKPEKTTSYEDSNYYYLNSLNLISNSRLKNRSVKSYYRIQCSGFADIVLESLDINRALDELPIIIVKMYKSQFYLKGDYYYKLDEYVLKNLSVNKDTNWITQAELLASFKEEPTEITLARIQAMNFKSYPNPLVDKIYIEIKVEIKEPYLIEILDMYGKTIMKQETYEAITTLDVEFLSSAMYFVKLTNYKGEMQFCRRMVKT